MQLTKKEKGFLSDEKEWWKRAQDFWVGQWCKGLQQCCFQLKSSFVTPHTCLKWRKIY